MTYKRIAIIGSASGSGKTTLARSLAAHMGATFVELDAFLHGPNWTEATDEELRAQVAPIVATESWVIDGLAEKKLGRLVFDAVDLVVWLDLPPSVWLPRLLARSARLWLSKEPLWNGNRETLRGVFFKRDGLVPYALRSWFRWRRGLAAQLNAEIAEGGKRVVRLCTVDEVADFAAALKRIR
ncbi:MAG: Adenylate kinaselike kinase [Myxococcales bacterium]|nr:Adenylate kinaselike kinase [Myxococcales bacterium]